MGFSGGRSTIRHRAVGVVAPSLGPDTGERGFADRRAQARSRRDQSLRLRVSWAFYEIDSHANSDLQRKIISRSNKEES